MSTTVQYASIPKNESCLLTTGDVSRTAPTTVQTVWVPGINGSRIIGIRAQAAATTTATMLRLFIVDCQAGPIPTTITFVSSTATVITPTSHGLTTGDKVTIRGAFPYLYNVTDVAITVDSLVAFHFTMTGTPTINAIAVGNYVTTPATAIYKLVDETPISAVTPSSSVEAPSFELSLINPALLPFILAPNKLLRATLNDTQTGVSVISTGADL